MSSLEYDRLASTSTRDPYQTNAIIQELRSVVQNFQSGLDKIGNRSFREQGRFMCVQLLSNPDSRCLGIQCEDLNNDKTAPKHVQGRCCSTYATALFLLLPQTINLSQKSNENEKSLRYDDWSILCPKVVSHLCFSVPQSDAIEQGPRLSQQLLERYLMRLEAHERFFFPHYTP